jgi:hypothetical protein
MPAKGHSNRQKTALDTEIAQLVIAFERDLYKYVDTVIPKKRKYSLVAACEARAMMARDFIVEGLDYDINLYSREKHRLLTEARAKLRSLTVDLQQLNDTGDISNTAKAHFDEQLDDIQTNLAKILNSLSKRIDLASLS